MKKILTAMMAMILQNGHALQLCSAGPPWFTNAWVPTGALPTGAAGHYQTVWHANRRDERIDGESRCSSTAGVLNNIGNPSSRSGSHCWCRRTSVSGMDAPIGHWVYPLQAATTEADCLRFCANRCASTIQHDATFRIGVLSLPPTWFTTAWVPHFHQPGGSSPGVTLWHASHHSERVDGESRCSTTSGSIGQTGNPVGTEGRFCWCRRTFVSGISVPGPWVFRVDQQLPFSCDSHCASSCGMAMRDNATFRTAILRFP